MFFLNKSTVLLFLRPGYPFLGNDFFREVGDVFATHAIPNPDVESEKLLLKAYAPKTSDAVIHKLAASFSELRRMSDAGDINYPYSTREAVATAKHVRFEEENALMPHLSLVLLALISAALVFLFYFHSSRSFRRTVSSMHLRTCCISTRLTMSFTSSSSACSTGKRRKKVQRMHALKNATLLFPPLSSPLLFSHLFLLF